MKSQLADFLSLIYPRTCITCHQSLTSAEKFICLGCELDLPKWESSANKAQLQKKFVSQPKVEVSLALLNYMKSGMAQSLIQAIKYGGKRELAIWLGEKLGDQIQKELLEPIDIIIPVPLHKTRHTQRGYNQSDLIAAGISKVMDLKVSDSAMKRVKKTTTQTKKAKTDRWATMSSVFEVIEPNEITAKRVMVVDDVITTGATTGMLCDVMAKENPVSIVVVALAAVK